MRGTWKTCGVYEIRTRNGSYVGASSNIGGRWTHHRWALRHRKHHCRALQVAWDTEGEDSFTWLILERCEKGRLSEMEAKFIRSDSLNAWPAPTGKGVPKSTETRSKMSIAALAVASDPEERQRRSKRASDQWKSGNIGRKSA